jgi:hypothetical protein
MSRFGVDAGIASMLNHCLTVRLDRGPLQLVDQGTLLRSLPNPLTPAEQGRLRDARPSTLDGL